MLKMSLAFLLLAALLLPGCATSRPAAEKPCCPAAGAACCPAPGAVKEAAPAKDASLSAAPLAICCRCGEIKASPRCCKKMGFPMCTTCGFHSNSPGCLAGYKLGMKQDVPLCPQCGWETGSAQCCAKKQVKRCEQCGYAQGSPACLAKCTSPKSARPGAH